MTTTFNNFYIAAHEAGSTRGNLPLWANTNQNPITLTSTPQQTITKKMIEQVPGAFQLFNVLSPQECDTLIHISEHMGYTEDAAVSLKRNIRHNMNVNWITDNTTEQILWSRLSPLLKSSLQNNHTYSLGKTPLGLNQRFRFYRYEKGDYFATHTDGAWPGSRMIDNTPVTDAFGDRHSLFTCLIFLSENYSGGATTFLVDPTNPTKPARTLEGANTVAIKTPKGGMLFFPHGQHPLHCLHSSALINQGVKYIIRTDVLFSL